MPSIHVCPLSCLHETVTSLKASHLVTLMNEGAAFSRPTSVLDEHYLFIGTNDIIAPLEGYVLPTSAHVESLLTFIRAWDQESPLVIHCWAGISRSTAAAYITACALSPDRDEAEIAQELRRA